ncbi:MAG: DUF2333 family protein [Deltaproteobacteria bacterium]|jgi:hypothetical protein|nr:DUF2333 family protein [Deltaproteobacteria bacterium]
MLPQKLAFIQNFTFTKKAIIILIVAALFLFTLVVILANYSFPSFFKLPTQEPALPGVYFTESIISIGDEMFTNWLPNDKIWPTILMDNPQNFQLGELRALRDTLYRTQENLSRQRSSDITDPDLLEAVRAINMSPDSWIFPRAESSFLSAMDSLRKYRDKILSGEAKFVPRADNLSDLLVQYVSILGDVNSRLAQAPSREDFISTETMQTTLDELSSEEATELAESQKNTPYFQIDNNFYYAQGVAYVIRQMMVAIQVDFKDILNTKKADGLVTDIIFTLDIAQFEPWIVLNGDVGSITANHSMELHSILENSRQKINNLIEMISQ